MKTANWEKAKRIFGAALKLTPGERSRFLDEACAGDADTRREVESLLANSDEAASFLEQPAIGEVADSILGENKKLASGRRLSHYEIVRQIGAGGMGEVYLAEDKKLDRLVAVKILNERFARHESNLKRFTKEAKAASALNHPNILVIHEIGESEAAHYIVSEFIEGVTLRERFTESTMKLSEVLDISIQIAGALVAAHAAHIVHRDIKPENIIVRPDGYVKVLDFGLAKLVGEHKALIGLEDETAKQNETAKGIILGTVNYMSPEQAKGMPVDERTDIFSFGVLIYEMIAARTPFAGNTMSETFANLINSEPQPLARYAAAVPEELQRIVSKTLRKDKENRYQTMRDVLADLKNLHKRLEFEAEFNRFGISPSDGSAGKQGTQILDGPATKKTKPPKRAAQNTNSIAVLPFANMSTDAENEFFCDGLAEELLNALAKIDDLKVAARTSAFSFKGKNTTVGEIGNILNVNTILEGSVRKSGNRLRITVQLVKASNGYHLWSERYDREMQDIFDVQDEITLAVVNVLKVKLLSGEKAAVLKRYTDDPKAYELYLKGIYYRWKVTPEEFGKCLKYFEQAVDADPNFALAYFGVASYYGYGTAWGLLPMPPEKGWAKAEIAIAKALEIDETLPETQLTLAAFKLVNHRDWTIGGTSIKRAAESNPKFPEIHHLYSFYLLAVGRFDEAISEAECALELDPLSLNYSRFLSICFFFARRYDEAIRQFNLTLELEPNNSSVHEILGGVYVQKGMFAEAVAAWQRAATLEGDDELAAILSRAKDNFAAAAQAVAQKRIQRLNAKTASGEFVLAINFARAYLMLGDEEQTFYWLGKAVEERNVFPLLMNSDPFYDHVRSNPRFQDLLRRIGLLTDENTHSATTNEANKKTLEAKATTDSLVQSQTSESTVASRFKNQKHIFTGSLIIFLLATVSFGYYFWTVKNPNVSVSGKKSLAVLPFVNASQDANAEYLSDGITESIINNLSQLTGLRVMSRNSAFRFKSNQTDVKAIAAQLGVETLVTGDIKQIGDKLIINVRLIDASDDSQIWGNQYVKTSGDVLAAQTEIAQAVAQNLRLKLTNSEQQRLAKNYTNNPEAYELYLHGRFHQFKITEPEIRKAIVYFEQAIAVDPNYALAYAATANAYRSLAITTFAPSKEVIPKSKAAALRAIEIDDSLAEGYAALGWTGFLYDWNWSEAERNLQKAVELNPNNVDVRLAYAHLLSNLGRHEEAIAQSKRMRELDPLTLIVNALDGQFLFYAGRFPEAIERLQKTLELDPNFWVAHNALGRVYISQGRWDEAIAELTKAKELSGGSTEPVTQLGYALAKSGNRQGAQATLEELKRFAAANYVPAYNFAMIYNGLGEKEEALNYLEKSFQEREVQLTFIKIDRRWDELRSAPRFVEIVKQMNLE